MKETTPMLRRNIKCRRLIRSSICICFIILIGTPEMQVNIEVDKTFKKETQEVDVTKNAELSVEVSNNILHLSKEPLLEPQVEKLEVEITTSKSNAEPEIVYKSLEEVKISRDMDLTETAGLSREDFCELLANFKYDYDGFYERNAGLIWDLSQEYQVNEIFICGVFALESLYGSDDIHEKTHNYGSIMTKGGELVKYETDAEGIEANFKLLSNCYLNPEGKYYKGVTLDSIGDTYCPPTEECPSWAAKVYSCMKKFLEE